MAELLGTVAAAGQLIGSFFSLIELASRIKDCTSALQTWQLQLEQLRKISEHILKDPSLPPEIEDCTYCLLTLLVDNDLEHLIRRGRVRRSLSFLHREKKIAEAFASIDRQKSTLNLIMSAARTKVADTAQPAAETKNIPQRPSLRFPDGIYIGPDGLSGSPSSFSESTSSLTLTQSRARPQQLMAPEVPLMDGDMTSTRDFEGPRVNRTNAAHYAEALAMARSCWEIDPEAAVYHGNTAQSGQNMHNGMVVNVNGPLGDTSRQQSGPNRLLASSFYFDCQIEGNARQQNGNNMTLSSFEDLRSIGNLNRSLYVGCDAVSASDNDHPHRPNMQNGIHNGHRVDIYRQERSNRG